MILDEFGRPIGGSATFLARAWLVREGLAQDAAYLATRRVRELRQSVVGFDETRVGATVRVKLPQRYR